MSKFKTLKLIQSRDEIKSDPAKVGQAVYDIATKPQYEQSVEETLDAMTPKYIDELYKTIDENKKNFKTTFYIVVLRKKEFWAMNVLRQWYVARQTRPSARVMREDYPNHDHDVWRVDPVACTVDFMWTLPTKQDCKTITDHPNQYSAELVATIKMFNEGKLD